MLGPILYLLLPDSLSRTLREAGCGIAIAPCIPQGWADVRWTGAGSPRHDMVELCLDGLRNRTTLPEAAILQGCPTMLASATKALDLLSGRPLGNLLHADDPVLFASSHGDMVRVLEVAAKWSWVHGARFHVGNNKSVVFVLGGGEHGLPPLHMEISPGRWAQLSYGYEAHLWLGWRWDWQGGAQATLSTRCGSTSSQLAVLAGLVTAGAIPLPLALVLLHAKVDGVLAPGRWLYAIKALDGQEKLNEVWDKSLRALVGAPPWASGMALRWEMGIPLSGAASAILQIAARRAYLWTLPVDDIYRSTFITAHDFCTSWATLSRRGLEAWGLVDFPASGLSVSRYKSLVRKCLTERCCADLVSSLSARNCSIPFATAYPAACLPAVLQDALHSPVGWQCLVSIRSLCRLRLGLLPLAHRGGKRSCAKHRFCILCNAPTSSPVAHAVLYCPLLGELRRELSLMQVWGESDGRLARLFSLLPQDEGFSVFVCLAQKLDAAAVEFWKSSRGSLKMICP